MKMYHHIGACCIFC